MNFRNVILQDTHEFTIFLRKKIFFCIYEWMLKHLEDISIFAQAGFQKRVTSDDRNLQNKMFNTLCDLEIKTPIE